jgi:hypothetical protein
MHESACAGGGASPKDRPHPFVTSVRKFSVPSDFSIPALTTGCAIERAYVDKGYRGHVFGVIKRELRA